MGIRWSRPTPDGRPFGQTRCRRERFGVNLRPTTVKPILPVSLLLAALLVSVSARSAPEAVPTRAARHAAHDVELANAAKSLNTACGTTITASIVWSSISDEQLGAYSISSYCANPLSAMQRLCESPGLRVAIQTMVKQMSCQFGAELKLDLDSKGTLSFSTAAGSSNLEEFAKAYWEGMAIPPSLGTPLSVKSPEPPPWGQLNTFGEQAQLEATNVCSDGKAAFVVLAPDRQILYRMYYGDGKKFARVPPPAGRLSGSSFFDPRVSNPNANPNFRGLDMRTYSSVELDTKKKTCVVQCGTRRADLKLLEPKAARDLLSAAVFGPPLHGYKPHVLTRDDRGFYYYVDRGNTPLTEKKFRLFAGLRGKLKLQPLTNIVSDSQGDIFSTKSGSLRFIAGPGGAQSSWVQGKKVTPLTAIPVADNFGLIYNDLGVYASERLGTPCDDL